MSIFIFLCIWYSWWTLICLWAYVLLPLPLDGLNWLHYICRGFLRLQNDSVTSWPRAWKFTSQPNLCKGKQTAISNTPAAAIDNFSPLGECMCHSGRRCLFASGSYGWHSGPQHITDSFCPWFRQPCHCQCVCVFAKCTAADPCRKFWMLLGFWQDVLANSSLCALCKAWDANYMLI